MTNEELRKIEGEARVIKGQIEQLSKSLGFRTTDFSSRLDRQTQLLEQILEKLSGAPAVDRVSTEEAEARLSELTAATGIRQTLQMRRLSFLTRRLEALTEKMNQGQMNRGPEVAVGRIHALHMPRDTWGVLDDEDPDWSMYGHPVSHDQSLLEECAFLVSAPRAPGPVGPKPTSETPYQRLNACGHLYEEAMPLEVSRPTAGDFDIQVLKAPCDLWIEKIVVALPESCAEGIQSRASVRVGNLTVYPSRYQHCSHRAELTFAAPVFVPAGVEIELRHVGHGSDWHGQLRGMIYVRRLLSHVFQQALSMWAAKLETVPREFLGPPKICEGERKYLQPGKRLGEVFYAYLDEPMWVTDLEVQLTRDVSGQVDAWYPQVGSRLVPLPRMAVDTFNLFGQVPYHLAFAKEQATVQLENRGPEGTSACLLARGYALRRDANWESFLCDQIVAWDAQNKHAESL